MARSVNPVEPRTACESNERSRPARRIVPARHSGAAIVSVILVVALVSSIVASLFVREHIAIRSVANRQDRAQSRWIERMAIDWGRFVLQADLRLGAVDHPGELWATPVDETVLDETVTAGARLERLPRLRGRIIDAQGLFNLSNLVEAGALGPQASPVHLAAFRRLLGYLDLPESLADLLVTRLLPTLGRVVDGASIPPEQPRLLRLTDLREIRGFDEGTILLLSDHTILLPTRTLVNLNTATPEVLAAYLDVDPAQARQLISERGESFYKDIADAQARMRLGEEADLSLFSVSSDYFLVRGMVRFGRIENELMSLLHRSGNTVEVQWQYRL